MVAITSTLRTDEQLEFVLYETANWTVNSGNGSVLCEVASLWLATEKAVEFAAVGREAVALMSRRSPLIVVLSDQVRMLANRLVLSQGLSGRRVAVPVNETNDGFGGVPSVLIEANTIYLEAVV
jgi:hypothetical protein